MEIRPEPLLRELRVRGGGSPLLVEHPHVLARDPLRGEDPWAGVKVERTREVYVGESTEVVSDAPEIVGLPPVAELAEQGHPEALEHAGELQASAEVRVAIERTGDRLHRLDVRDDLGTDGGRCTLTATSRPSRRRPRWTWPREAAAIGSALKDSKRRSPGLPSSSVTIWWASSESKGSTWSWRRASASR